MTQPLPHQFRAFVASKDPSEGYEFFSSTWCAVGQFTATLSLRSWDNIHPFQSLHQRFDEQLRTRPWTFGALALRLSSEERVDG